MRYRVVGNAVPPALFQVVAGNFPNIGIETENVKKPFEILQTDKRAAKRKKYGWVSARYSCQVCSLTK